MCVWNEFVFALTFVTRMEMRTLTVGLYKFVGRWTVQWHHLMAAALVGVVPVVILFMLVQRHLVHGLTLGAGVVELFCSVPDRTKIASHEVTKIAAPAMGCPVSTSTSAPLSTIAARLIARCSPPGRAEGLAAALCSRC